MTLGELLELAAILTANAPLLIEGDDALSAESLALYWSASKCRQQRWILSLKQIADAANRQDESPRPRASEARRAASAVPATLSVLDEILASEVLTRVFATVAVLHDRRRGASDAGPVARSVFMNHLESRRRALTLLANGLPTGARDGPTINRRRRRLERWNDLLIGHLRSHGQIDEFAYEPETAAQFADDFRGQGRQADSIGWTLLMASLRAAAREFSAVGGGNNDLHQQIGAAVLGCFGHDAFESVGLPRSLWAARLWHTADRADELIERWFAADRPGVGFIARR